MFHVEHLKRGKMKSRIKGLMRKQKLTFKALSEKSEVSIPTIQKAQVKIEHCTLQTLLKLSKALNCKLTNLWS